MKSLLLYALLFLSFNLFAGIEKIPDGAFIVNLGISPQTKENGLKPYGLVYDMLQNFHVPVKWAINPTKIKDGVDFTYNQTAYKGGSFIILAQYRTAEVNQAIAAWIAKGVVGETTTSELSVEVFATLTYAPRWTVDKTSGTLVTPFFQNAGIPASAHGGANQTSWKNPADLTACDDIYILPHADPRWDTHNNLLTWNKNAKGAIWSGCHAVSVMENIVSPNGLSKMNFLTTTGMVNYNAHTIAQAPLNYSYPGDPVMQFIGKIDDAAITGSETVYLPKAGGSWRPGVKLSVIDPDHPQVSSLSPGPAGLIAYGYGFDDTSRGLIMYQGGHFHDGGTGSGLGGTPFNSDHVALQRAFFNFSFLAVVDRQSNSFFATIQSSDKIAEGASKPIQFSVPSNVVLSDYQVRWSASAGTITPGSTPNNIVYTAPASGDIDIALITLFLKDACGREFFTTRNIEILHEEQIPDDEIPADSAVQVPRLVSANADGRGHDFLLIKNIELYTSNEIQIFNRWGIMVYEIKNYDNDARAFRGLGNKQGNTENLIDGVYYYVLKLKDSKGKESTIKNYFILKK